MATIDLHANRAEADAHTAGRGATAGGGCSCGTAAHTSAQVSDDGSDAPIPLPA